MDGYGIIITAMGSAIVGLLVGYAKMMSILRRSKSKQSEQETELELRRTKVEAETKETAKKSAEEAWQKWSENVYEKFNNGLMKIDKLQGDKLKLAQELTEVRTQLAETRAQLTAANVEIERLKERVVILEKTFKA